MLEWRDAGADREKVETYTGREPPHADFTRSLADLVPSVLTLLELPDDYGAVLTVRGVTFTPS